MMNKDLITRTFTTTRTHKKKDGTESDFVQKYRFSTFSYVINNHDDIHPNLKKLFDYLTTLIIEGRPEIGLKQSVSQAQIIPLLARSKGKTAETKLADLSLYSGQGQDQHQVLEDYFLQADKKTVATEIPVWNDQYLGHIDIIQWDDETKMIKVLDFKPNAKSEKKAASQVFRYCHLLAARLGISIKEIEGAYFDKDNYFVVDF